MRIVGKLLLKFSFMIAMVLVMGTGLKRGPQLIMKAMGKEAPQFSSEESDLMSSIMQSALKLVSGQAKREDLASELSEKLYGGRADAGDMNELGIELVKPGGASPLDELGGAKAGQPAAAGAKPIATAKAGQPATTSPTKPAQPAASPSPADPMAKINALADGGPLPKPIGDKQLAVYIQLWGRIKPYSLELGLAPLVFFGMVLVQKIRGKKSKADDMLIPLVVVPAQNDSEPYDMKHAVYGLGAEEFELLVALIYQRQGYRVTMPSALSGGRGGDFQLARKAERILVQCKKLPQEHRIPVERVRELHEAMTAAGLPKAYFVTSCGFTWDARNFAKTRGVTLISARTLDELLLAARETPGEDLLNVEPWITKLLGKIKFTPPLCPACEASMDEITISEKSTWLCSQRPDCKARRPGRKFVKTAPPRSTPAEPVAEMAEVA